MMVVLEAWPVAGMIFEGWSGDCNGTEEQLIVPFNKDMTCQATFIDPSTVVSQKQDQTITNFSPVTPAVVGDQATLTATGGASNNPVTFANTTPEVCTVSGNTLNVTKAGTCTVTADQAGNDQYNPATQVTANIEVKSSAVVAKKDQVITNFVPATSATVNTDAALTATGGASGNAVTFASTTPAICTVSGQTVNLVALGTCTVTANQEGNDQYNPAPTVTASIEVKSAAVVVKKDQVITNFSPTGYAFTVDKAMVNGQTTLTATGGASGNPVVPTKPWRYLKSVCYENRDREQESPGPRACGQGHGHRRG